MSKTEQRQGILLRTTRAKNASPPAAKKEKSPPVLENIFVGVQQITKTALYISCGAAMYAWEAIEKVVQSLYGSRTHARFLVKNAEKTPKPPGRAQKIKIPILPIDDYDRLDESQIVPQLEGLSDRALRLLRGYEEENRNRGAILREIDRRLMGRR